MRSLMKMLSKEAIHRINIGDGLTKRELTDALIFYKDLSNMLNILGPEFKHAWREVNSTLDRLEGFQRARDRK